MVFKGSGTKNQDSKPQAEASELADILHQQMGAVVVVNADNKVEYLNPAAAKLLKKRPKKILGQNYPYPLEDGNLPDVDVEAKIDKGKWNGDDASIVYLKSLKGGQAAFHIEWRIESAEAKAREAEEKIKALEAKLAEAPAAVAAPAEGGPDAAELRKHIEQLQQQIDQLHDENDSVNTRLEETEALLETAERKIDEAETRTSMESHQMSTELQDALAQSRELEEQLREAEERIREAEDRIQMAEEQSEEAEERAYAAEGLLAEAEQRASEAEQKLEEQQPAEGGEDERLQNLQQQIENLQAQLAESQQQAEQVRQQSDEVRQKLAEAEKAAEEAQSRTKSLEQQLQGAGTGSQEAEELKAQLTEQSQLIEELQIQADAATVLEEELEELRTSLEELENLRAQVDQLEALDSEIAILKEAASVSESLQQEVEDLTAALEESENRADQALRELDEARNQPQVDPEVEERVKELEAELNLTQSQLKRAEEMLGDQDNVVKLERKLEGALRRAAELEEELSERQSLIDEIKLASVARIEELETALERARTGLSSEGGEGGAVDPETERLAFQDPLTGLPNVNIIRRYLDFMLKQAERYQRSTALLAIDLDRFKMVNDALGFKVGDELLCLVAERLSSVVRGSDVLGRRGEDEFIILLSELSGQEEATSMASAVANRVYEVLRPPFVVGDQKVHIGASIGVSIYPSDSKTAEQMLEHADESMHRAKELGRGRFQFFTPELQNRHDVRTRLDGELRRGLEGNQFQLVYQPIFNLGTGRMAGVESLVRWKHSTQGIIGPDEFLQAAEETGLIVPIGRWAIFNAVAQAQRWQSEGLDLFVSINISKRQLLQADLSQVFLDAVSQTQCNPALICIELTEELARIDTARVQEQLKEMRAAGLRFAIDNFGTGHSSLETLNHEHYAQVKVDRRFTVGVPEDKKATNVVLAALALARNLQMTPVVVGIENKQQKNLMMKLDCELGQGNFLSEPLEAQMISQIADRVFS